MPKIKVEEVIPIVKSWAKNYCRAVLPADSSEEEINACKVNMQERLIDTLDLTEETAE